MFGLAWVVADHGWVSVVWLYVGLGLFVVYDVFAFGLVLCFMLNCVYYELCCLVCYLIVFVYLVVFNV